MNAVKYAAKDVKVNDGTVRASEVPVFVGLSKVTDAVNGRYCTMSITVDRDWVWVRLSSQPSEKFKSKLVSCGFTFSRKRMGWHAPISELVCKTLRDFGYAEAQHHKLVGLEPPRNTDIRQHEGNLDLDAPVQDAIANKSKAASQPASTKTKTNANAKKIAALEEQNAQLASNMAAMQQVMMQQSALLARLAEKMLA